jgi:hypothetical protein
MNNPTAPEPPRHLSPESRALRAAEREPRRVADPGECQLGCGATRRRRRGHLPADQARSRDLQRGLAPGAHRPHVRSSLIEPGATEGELVSHVRKEVRSQLPASDTQIPAAEDIADAILYIVARPRHTWRSTRSWFALRSRCASAPAARACAPAAAGRGAWTSQPGGAILPRCRAMAASAAMRSTLVSGHIARSPRRRCVAAGPRTARSSSRSRPARGSDGRHSAPRP